jgi:hypothetical protein
MSMVSIVFAGLIVGYSLNIETINAPFSNVKLDKAMHNEVIRINKADYDKIQSLDSPDLVSDGAENDKSVR